MKKIPICIYIYVYIYYWAFLVAQSVKNLPAVQETRVWFLGWEDPLEKEMATYSSILAWQVSWTEEPGGLQSVGSQRVRHDERLTLTYLLYLLLCNVYVWWASLAAQMVKNLPAVQETQVRKIPWRREQLPTPVFLPGEFHGQKSLDGSFSPWGHKESDTTEQLTMYV